MVVKVLNTLFLFILFSSTYSIRPGCTILYEKCNYKGNINKLNIILGRRAIICSNQYVLCHYNFNYLASSVKLGPGTAVILYDMLFYNGKKWKFSWNTPFPVLEVSVEKQFP